ncbi:MAG: hypothetical protein CVT48_04920 [Thermoplasmata archaeon HGW-Thermoplasmata-1]|nr:MAG: hypothetical protein CVT48_04920 [Thermoplasmata archaeon HGW-Thermoplasmata-1]
MDDLTPLDKKIYDYLCKNDFQANKFVGADAAKTLHCELDEVYVSLANICKHIKDKIWMSYRDGGIRIITAD